MSAAVQIARFPKENGSRARTVVITQGKDPTVIASMGKVGIRHAYAASHSAMPWPCFELPPAQTGLTARTVL